MCHMMGVPAGPFCVVDLPEGLARGGEETFPVMVSSAEGIRIKLLQPAPQGLRGKFVMPALHVHDSQTERAFGKIVTDRQDDMLAFTCKSGASLDDVPQPPSEQGRSFASSSSGAATTPRDAIDEDQSPLGIKVAGMRVATQASLKAAAETATQGTGWQKNPMKILKNHFTRLQTVQTELLHCPNKALYCAVEDMQKAVSSAQALFKGLVVYAKRFNNLEEIFTSSRCSVEPKI